MALDLSTVPAARPGQSAVVAALEDGVLATDPQPSLLIADRAHVELLRLVLVDLRAGLLTVDGLVASLTAALAGKASVESVAALGAALASLQDVVDALPAGGGGDVTQEQLDAALGTRVSFAALSEALSEVRDRGTHTGTQAISTVTGLQPALDGKAGTQALADGLTAARSRTNHTGTQTAATISDFSPAVQAIVSTIVGAAPASLDTLTELAAALGNDSSFAATVTASLAAKAPLASPAFTGTPTVDGVPLAPVVDASTTLAGRVVLAGDLAGTASAPTVPKLAEKLGLSQVRVAADDPGVLELIIATSAPEPQPDPDPSNPDDPTPPPPTTGDPVDALLPHPYMTPRNYTAALVGGGTEALADPYQPFAYDRPPSKAGVPVGRLAAPAAYDYPDETNTGPVTGTVLKRITGGTISVTDAGATLPGQSIARPAAGQPPVTLGPVTLYPLANPLLVTDPKVIHIPNFPFATVFDGALTNNTLTNTGRGNILGRNCILDGNGRRGGPLLNKPTGTSADMASWGFMVLSQCRVHGGGNAEAAVTADSIRIYFHRCNVTGGADIFQPKHNVYVDFCYGHGTRRVETRHQDAIQLVRMLPSASISPYFGGWAGRVRRSTLLSYGEKVGSQWMQFGATQDEVANFLLQDVIGAGGQYMFGYAFANYDSIANDANGNPITKQSVITGQPETYWPVRNIFIENIRLGRKAADGFPGCGSNGGKSPAYGVTATRTSSPYFSGLHGNPPPVSQRGIVWDDTGEQALFDAGRTDWAAAAATEGLDFTPYTPGA